MCNPAAWAVGSAIVEGVKTGVELYSQNQMAGAAAQSANNAAMADYNALQEQAIEVGQQANLEQTERIRQGIRERAQIRVALGEAGLTGVSPDRQISTSYTEQGYDLGIMETNKQNRMGQIAAEKYKVRTIAQSRINEAKSQITNPFLGVLKIGANMLTTYGNAKSIANSTFKSPKKITAKAGGINKHNGY